MLEADMSSPCEPPSLGISKKQMSDPNYVRDFAWWELSSQGAGGGTPPPSQQKRFHSSKKQWGIIFPM
eukprot:4982733-Amphidinium_carterae.1